MASELAARLEDVSCAREPCDLYDRLAPFYDLGTGTFDEDIGLYLGFARRTRQPVLELGCGSGRLLLPLTQAGCVVVGVDRSREMLARARRRLEGAAGGPAYLLQADMRCLPFGGRFGLIFCALDSFLHLRARDEQLAVLRGARALLSRRGALVLDLPGPAAEGWEDWTAGVRPLVLAWTLPLPGGARLNKYSSFSADASTQTHVVTEIYERTSAEGEVRRWVAEYELRFVFPAELELLLDAAALRLVGRYGDYELGAFGPSSPRQICIAVAAPRRSGS